MDLDFILFYIYRESDDATGGASGINRELILNLNKNCSFLFTMVGRTGQTELNDVR